MWAWWYIRKLNKMKPLIPDELNLKIEIPLSEIIDEIEEDTLTEFRKFQQHINRNVKN